MQKWELWVHHDGYYQGCDWNGGMVFTPEGFRLDTPDYEIWKGPEEVNPFDVRAYWNCDTLPYCISGPVLKLVPTPPHYPWMSQPATNETAKKGK
jgi:hypothetical protein